jgi:hypothetical protein
MLEDIDEMMSQFWKSMRSSHTEMPWIAVTFWQMDVPTAEDWPPPFKFGGADRSFIARKT